MNSLFKTNAGARKGRWVYLIASIWPAVVVVTDLSSRHPSYGYGSWLAAALLVASIVQFLRPCLVGALAVGGSYAFLTLGTIAIQVEMFQDFGSEDHSRWEGWDTEWILLTCTVFLAWLTVSVVLHARKLTKNTT